MTIKVYTNLRQNPGFSLIELITTFAIVGILASLALAIFNQYSDNIAQISLENFYHSTNLALEGVIPDTTAAIDRVHNFYQLAYEFNLDGSAEQGFSCDVNGGGDTSCFSNPTQESQIENYFFQSMSAYLDAEKYAFSVLYMTNITYYYLCLKQYNEVYNLSVITIQDPTVHFYDYHHFDDPLEKAYCETIL